ncbi:PIG-P-domain-containing protein [Glomus cerebriforme]|uniref:PIG-P-domain-containing protein n=1 Tax=Glomus cerebriforme TaxID=658196 RepID=A0A397T8G4_9GLOM|nr:PIG-P-domain-containing protein [Glomus cerebriforme]
MEYSSSENESKPRPVSFNNVLFSAETADSYFQYSENNENSQEQSSSTSTQHQTKPIYPRTPRTLGIKRTASYSSLLANKSESSKSNSSTSQNDLSKNHVPGVTNLYPTDESPTTLTKTPTYEYYGFVLYLSSFIAFVIYLLWAYLPDEILISLGITYYPDRYWALALPVWSFVLVLFIYAAFISINFLNTKSFDSYNTITDDYANVGQNLSQLSGITDDFVPELHDIPIGIVNACLYQNVDGLGLWEEEEENNNNNKENIYDNNQNVEGGGEESGESGLGNKLKIMVLLSVIIIILLDFYLLDIHLKIFEWFLNQDSSLDDL